MRSLLGVVVLLTMTLWAPWASAERPVLLTIDDPHPGPIITAATAPYNTIFLNRCANGCQVKSGGNNSSAVPDTSPIVSGTRTLTKFTYDDATWNKVVACVKDTFSPFNVNITDVDPGSANHFEIMIGGDPTDLGFGSNTGGVSTNGCGNSYLPNAVVFDFANVWSGHTATCNQQCIEDTCATAAQEIGHSFGMDHSHNAADPMTYFGFATRKYFQNSADVCGSDCVAGVGPSGQTCTGTDKQLHGCCGNGASQNSYGKLQTLFGAGTPMLPIVAITKPQQGASVQAGFNVVATVTANAIVTKAELRVDGTLITPTLTSQPFAFNTPTTLMPGSHTVEVTGYDAHGTAGKTSVTVTIGPPCGSAADCSIATDACIGGRCVPGPGVTGGLGESCTANTDCGDSNCASDGTNMYCTTACTAGQCPDNFGCLPIADGSDAGYCWPGYNDGNAGGGCCNTGSRSGSGGTIGFGLLFAALLVARRRWG